MNYRIIGWSEKHNDHTVQWDNGVIGLLLGDGEPLPIERPVDNQSTTNGDKRNVPTRGRTNRKADKA